MSGCSAVGCSNRGDRGYFMKSFPRNPERRALWAMQMKRDNWQPNNNCRLCEVHFDDDQWEKTRQDGTRKLKSNAVPTLFQYSEKTTKRKSRERDLLIKEPKRLKNFEENDLSILQKEYNHHNPRFDRNASKNNSVDSALRVSSRDVQREGEDARCRLCATRNGTDYTSIFGESDLAEKISRCLPIIVLHSDKLPLQVCQQCLIDLNVSYNLIIGSLRADSILRSEFLETSTKLDSAPKDEPVFRINGPIRCDMCDRYFEDMTEFDTHIETEHQLRWRCALCDHSFETRQELVAHETLRHSTEIEAFSKSAEELETEDPENSEVKDTSLTCTKCGIVFDDQKQFQKHHTIHLPKRLKCSICRKRCSSMFEYLKHKRTTHHTVKINSRNSVHGCKYCKKVFIRKQHLLFHLRKHKKEMIDDPSVTVYECVTCPKKFVDRSLYQKHRNVHDPDCWHKYRCYTCDKSFMDQFKLRIHRAIHDGAKPYQCDVCGHAFNRNANMIRHRAKHFEQTCRHCHVVFKNSPSLRVHLKDVHGDTLKPRNTSKGVKKMAGGVRDSEKFICRYCGKQLTSNCSLLDHERIHTGDKPYVCEYCGKAFRSITARWDHMVRHEKGNYVCEFCGKIMSNRLNLTRHLRCHAAIEERKFECKVCGKLFHVAWRLNAHRARIHRSDTDGIELDEKSLEGGGGGGKMKKPIPNKEQ